MSSRDCLLLSAGSFPGPLMTHGVVSAYLNSSVCSSLVSSTLPCKIIAISASPNAELLFLQLSKSLQALGGFSFLALQPRNSKVVSCNHRAHLNCFPCFRDYYLYCLLSNVQKLLFYIFRLVFWQKDKSSP